jgi:hypothetical protein
MPSLNTGDFERKTPDGREIAQQRGHAGASAQAPSVDA